VDEFSVKQVAELFGLQEARLRYWAQTGFVGPSVRKRGRFFYTFQDLVSVKLAKELLAGGLSLQKVRRNLDALRRALPEAERPLSKLRVCSDGETLVVLDRDRAFAPTSGQVIMDFALEALSVQAAEIHAIAPALGSGRAPADERSAYRCFLDGCEAEARGDLARARAAFSRALELAPALAAAHTNLGNLDHVAGDHAAARARYERALALDPEQPEARFNLGNTLDDLGETELAIAELRQVCSRCPEFADAHYNLAVILVRVGGHGQARDHFRRYLALDPDSAWAARARAYLDQPASADAG
jgi:tetratricopeptide (TPR) repeat protein